ncbi:LysR family transcriptional regulator [Brucella vulpis]|nr:LysR family transcriptional regulator [Brucella vulpis]CUW51025.1 LysR family transcriptional regulator [Brucella vulpis]
MPHGAELTAAGAAFLEEATATIASSEKAKLAAQRAARGESGRLSLGFTASSAFNPIVSGAIRHFRAKWPEVELFLTEMNTNLLIERLVRGELDTAFIRPGLEDPANVRMKRLADEPMLVALPSHHRLRFTSGCRFPHWRENPSFSFRASWVSAYMTILPQPAAWPVLR